MPIVMIQKAQPKRRPLSEVSNNVQPKSQPTQESQDEPQPKPPVVRMRNHHTMVVRDVQASNVEIAGNCDQVRRKIRRFLDNDGMTLKDFLSAINGSSNAYYRFMKQHGAYKGEGSDIYDSASYFFRKREEEGLPMPKKRKSSAESKDDGKTTKKAKTAPGKETTDYDLTQAELTDEEEDSVPVYSTCDETRRQISHHLKKSNVTQASFLRDLKAQYHTSKAPARFTSSQLEKFRSKKGPHAGNTSSIFYASYVFFEKLRRKEGKPKSEFRLGMEERWSKDGGLTIDSLVTRFLCPDHMRPYEDKYGCVHLVEVGNSRSQ